MSSELADVGANVRPSGRMDRGTGTHRKESADTKFPCSEPILPKHTWTAARPWLQEQSARPSSRRLLHSGDAPDYRFRPCVVPRGGEGAVQAASWRLLS